MLYSGLFADFGGRSTFMGDRRQGEEATASFRALLVRSAVGLAVCAPLVALCYFFVDRQAAFFVHEQRVNKWEVLEWLTYLSMGFNALAPVVVVLAALQRAWRPLGRWERTLFAASVSLMVAVAFEYYLKFLFGRYWPETWVDDNPSLIGDGAYGFHPFHFGAGYGSFPSGHTARAFAFLTVVGVAYPAWRWACAAGCGAVVVGLVGMNYHFVGDTVGGAWLGAVVGRYAACFFGVEQASPRSAQG
jgi:membrane-associated phospholipid phosphatase